jgi:nucleotide-binding universal stress UspA family protein
MKKIKHALFASSLVCAMLTGCIRPYNRPAVVQIETNETAFLVDMRSDGSASADSMTKIQRKDVLIDGYWVQTGRFSNRGYWRPTQKVLVVSRKPVEIYWPASERDPVVRAVSSESVGFRIPLVINAAIQSDEDASSYLKWFKSNREANQSVQWDKIKASEWPVREEAEPLESAVNRVVFPVINNKLSELFLQVPIIECESKRVEFVTEAFETARREAAKYGITLLILSSTDGLLYDDPEFQNRINDLAVAKMYENVLRQEQLNAAAEQQVKTTQAQTEAEVARIQGQTVDIQRRQMEIEGQRLIYQAQADAIRTQADKAWPATLVVEDLDMLGSLGLVQK